MNANEMYKIFQDFLSNDFAHLWDKVEAQGKTTIKLFLIIIGGLLGVIGTLFALILNGK